MTDDELDLIASAYVDGEATPEEVALVERDPDLRARVEAMRALAREVSRPLSLPAPAVMEQHLTAARAGFEWASESGLAADAGVEPAAGAAAATEPALAEVIDLGRRRRSRPRRTDAPRTFPRWLSAAAVVLLVGGGAIIVANQAARSGEDSDEVATEAFDTGSDEAAEAAEESAGGAADDQAAELPSTTSQAARDADAELADVEEEATEEAAEAESAADEPASAEADRAAPADGEGTTRSGLFADEPRMFFDGVPDVDEVLADLPERRVDLERSACALDVEVPAGSEVVGFLPIEIGGGPAEILVVVDASGVESGIIVDDACRVMAP